MCKAICGVAAGATGGNINLHWSKGSDISDINAKFGAQNTVTGSLGLLCAAFFAKSISTTSPSIIWSLYAVLTSLHIYANMKCMRLIAFDYLNTARANILIEKFLTRGGLYGDLGPIYTPYDVSRLEPLFFLVGPRRMNTVSNYPIRMGVSFQELYKHSHDEAQELTEALQSSKKSYAISLGSRDRTTMIFVSLFTAATPRDSLEAYFLATLFGRRLERLGYPRTMNNHSIAAIDLRAQATSAMQDAKLEFQNLWPIFLKLSEQHGWSLDKTDLKTEGYLIEVAQGS
jgi:hypothetical protein